MKVALLLFTILPFLSFSQDLTKAISLSGGAEYHDSKTHAWNIDLAFNHRVTKSPRFWAEFGMNYSILEYKGDSGVKLDTINNQVAVGAIYAPGYIMRESVHYSKTSSLRIQAGINYMILDNEKFRLSTGLNIVNKLMSRRTEHGQRVLIPIETADTLEVIDYHFYSGQGLTNAPNAITVLLQPHADASIRLSNNLWFTSRLAYYWQVLPRLRHSRAQLNIGVRYEW